MTRDAPGLTAEETPALRRRLVEHMRGDGAAEMFALMVDVGRQPIRPPGPSGEVGRLLATTEADRLERADLWHIDADLTELVDAAYPSMPPFAPRVYDLPAPHGFVTFARPLTSLVREAIPGDRTAAELLTKDLPGVPAGGVLSHIDDPVPIVAVSWGPAVESAVGVGLHHRSPARWNRPGVWMSFWAASTLREVKALDRLGPAQRAVYNSFSAQLNVDNECLLGWCPDGADERDYLIGPGSGHAGTASWAAAVLATFALARQGNVAEQDDQTVPRPERRRHKSAGLPEPRAVRVLRLRRGVAAAAGATTGVGRERHHRWVVRGHWRNAWYPSLGIHRPRWIAPYLAGPPDKPLIGGEKVTLLGKPRPGAGSKETPVGDR